MVYTKEVNGISREKILATGGIGLLVLVILAGGIYYYFFSPEGRNANHLNAEHARFYVVAGDRVQWYEIQGTTVNAVRGPADFDTSSVDVIQAAQPMKSGDTPILVFNPPNIMQLVAMRGTPPHYSVYLSKDWLPKIGVADDDSGDVVFAEYIATSTAQKSPSKGQWTLVGTTLEETMPAGTNLGTGFDPVFIPKSNRSFLAIGPEGLVQVGAEGGRSTVVNAPNPDLPASAVAPDAQTALLYHDLTQQFDIFSLSTIPGTNTIQATYRSSLKTPALATAFLDTSTFIVQVDAHTFVLYEVTAKGAIKIKTLTL